MKRLPYRNQDAKEGAGHSDHSNTVDPNKEKHDHFKNVKHKLEGLAKDIEHGVSKGWISEEKAAEFGAMNAASQEFADSQLS